jgi:ferredoxin like protein
MKPLSVPERLTKNRFLLDEEQGHIEVNQEIARATGTGKLLVACCPARVYAEEPDGTISVEYAACLECGTCLAIAAPGALKWHYPRGGGGGGGGGGVCGFLLPPPAPWP